MTNNKLENITYFLFHGRMATVVVKSKRAIHKEKKFSHSTATHKYSLYCRDGVSN